MHRARRVAFSSWSWSVKASTAPVGPGPNVFSDSLKNVWVDIAGRLHLRVTCRDGCWQAAEVVLDHSLGYGSYRFTLASHADRLDPNVVLGLFTWSDGSTYHHREIDIEFARWGKSVDNGQYTVQPSTTGNSHTFVQPQTAPTTHEFRWLPDRVSFHSATARGITVAEWDYRGPDVPVAGDERTRINLWLYGGAAPTDGAEVEVVLSAFGFKPGIRATITGS